MYNYIFIIAIVLFIVLLIGVYAAIINFYLPEIIGTVAIIVLFIAFLFGVHAAATWRDDKRWNDGHCSVCGGTWEYEQAVGHRTSTSYIYVCTGCGKRIEINEVK